MLDALRASRSSGLVRRQRLPRGRRRSRSAARSAGARRGWRGSAPRAPRPGRRSPSALASIVGTTTSVRDCGGNAAREVHARQRLRRHEQRREPVHERDRELAGGEQRAGRRAARAASRATPSRARLRAAAPAASSAVTTRDRAEVAATAGRAAPIAAHARRAVRAHPAARSSCGRPVVDQVEADVGRALVVAVGVAATPRASRASCDGRARDLALRTSGAALGDLLDHVAVAVARGEVHAAVERRRDPRAAFARRRSSSRRTRASPSRRGSAGCRCCC